MVTEDRVSKKKIVGSGLKVSSKVDDSISDDGHEENGLGVYDGEDGEGDEEYDSDDGEMPDEFYDEELESGDGGEQNESDDYIELS